MPWVLDYDWSDSPFTSLSSLSLLTHERVVVATSPAGTLLRFSQIARLDLLHHTQRSTLQAQCMVKDHSHRPPYPSHVSWPTCRRHQASTPASCRRTYVPRTRHLVRRQDISARVKVRCRGMVRMDLYINAPRLPPSVTVYLSS